MRPDAGVWRKATRRAAKGIPGGRRGTHHAQRNLPQRGSSWARRHPFTVHRSVDSLLALHTLRQVGVAAGPEDGEILDVCGHCSDLLALPTRGRPMGVMYEPFPCETIRSVLPNRVLFPPGPRRDPWAS